MDRNIALKERTRNVHNFGQNISQKETTWEIQAQMGRSILK
jgi:hypothetical protein